MTRLLTILLTIAHPFLIVGCAALSTTISYYDFQPTRDSKTKDAMGHLTILELQQSAILFEFVNLSKRSAKIIWDESVLVDVDGNSHRIMHQGVRYIEAGNSMAPTLIPPGSKVTDMASFATGNRFIAAGNASTWLSSEIIPCSKVGSICNSQENIGKILMLVLAVEVEGKRHEYTAKMKIKKAD